MSIHNTLNINPSVSVISKDPYGLSGSEMRIRGVKSIYTGLTTEGVPNYGIYPIGGREGIYDAENINAITFYKGAVPADVFSASGNRGGSVDIRYKRPSEDFEVNINQSYGSDNFHRTFLRLDTGLSGNGKSSGFVSYSYTEGDKWKGKGKLAERNHVTAAFKQEINDKFQLELMYNYNQIFNHNFRNFKLGLVKDYKKNYYLDFNPKLTGNPSKDRFYYDYNKGNFKNHLAMALLHYKLDQDNYGSLKLYTTKEKASYSHLLPPITPPFIKPTEKPIFIMNDVERDLSQIGATINWTGKINDINYAAGYWFEIFTPDLIRFDKNIKDLSLVTAYPQYKQIWQGDCIYP